MRAIAAIRLNRDTPAFSRFKQVIALITISATLRPHELSALRVNSDPSAALGMTNKAVFANSLTNSESAQDDCRALRPVNWAYRPSRESR